MSSLPGRLRAAHARERWPRDYYVEPAFAVEELFDHVRFTSVIHDPCCGGGTIPTVAKARGYTATGSDLVDRGFGDGGVDFLQDTTSRTTIIMNPPYVAAEAFILHALMVVERRVAVIVPIGFLCGQQRRRTLFAPHPPGLVLVMSARPSMPPGGAGIPDKGGTTDYVWLGFDKAYVGLHKCVGQPDTSRR